MQLFIANSTRHNLQLPYRLPETRGIKIKEIGIGQQGVIGDLNKGQLDALIEHFSGYGMVAADSIDRSRGEFIGMCYSVDKPVTSGRLETALRHNDAVLVQRGKQLRQEAAVAVAPEIERAMEQGNFPPPTINKIDVEMIEQEPKDGYREGETPVADGVHIRRDATREEVARPAARASSQARRGRGAA